MSRRQAPPGTNEEIARMLAEGATRKHIARTLKVGFARIAAVAAGDMSFGEPLGTVDDEPAAFEDLQAEVMEQRPTVIVDADYLRALEALLFVTEQNRALRAAMEAA
jgi:hypothetical protein